MRRRITTAIVGVTAFILIAVGIPLAIVAQRAVARNEVVNLQAIAAETLTEIGRPLDVSQLDALRDEPDAPPPFEVYDTTGKLIFGDGPASIDGPTSSALGGSSGSSSDGPTVVATPITDQDENVIGALRVSTPSTDVNNRVRQLWLAIVVCGLVAVGLAWLIADRLGRRLASPIVDLADAARATNVGGVLEPQPPTGIAEIDQLHHALVDNSRRITSALVRERQFSADVSHQLRTPIAALRLKLDAAHSGGSVDPTAIDDLDRLQDTVDHLLATARDNTPIAATCSLNDVVDTAGVRWQPHAQSISRKLTTTTSSSSADVTASAVGMSQIVDVLIDNALRHGRGDIDLALRRVAGGIALDVRDEGTIDTAVNESALFDRREGTDHGIGLALARSLAHADGGRLMLTDRSPTCFTLVLPAPSSTATNDVTAAPFDAQNLAPRVMHSWPSATSQRDQIVGSVNASG